MNAESKGGGVRWGLLWGVAFALLAEYAVFKFFQAHSGSYDRVEDYVQVGLVVTFGLACAAIGVRYAMLLIGDLRQSD